MEERLNTMTTQPLPAPDPSSRLAPRMGELRTILEGTEPAVLAERTGSELAGNEFRLHLWGKAVILTLPGFIALDAATRQELRPDQQMLLLYYFGTADATPQTGKWISFADLPGGRFYNQAFQGYSGKELARAFQDDRAAFERAAQALDGVRHALGDAAFAFQALPRVSLLAVFWQGDEEFPSTCQVLFDAAASHYLPTDAYAILGGTLTRRLIKARR